MAQTIELKVPDIGDFKDVDVIEVLVNPGDNVAVEDSLITLESDKATMEVPASHAGVIKEVRIKVGDKVSEGSVVAVVEAAEAGAAQEETATPEQPAAEEPSKPAPAKPAEAQAASPADLPADLPADADADVLVLGSGPGGYTAAFRAADLGLKTILVERYASLGGVCLNVGCIPSKALLHSAKVIDEAKSFAEHGVVFGEPKIDPKKLLAWKEGVVNRLTGGLKGLAKQRKVEIVQGTGRFVSPHELEVDAGGEKRVITFKYCIVAAGSRAVLPPGMDLDDPRIMTSTGALELAEIPKRLLVIGGGIIGLEMATVYEALGSKVTVVELLDRLVAGCDADIVRPLQKRIQKRYENIFLKTRVTGIKAEKKGLSVTFEGDAAPEKDRFDRVLVAVGRRPNGDGINAEAAGLNVDERGFVPVDETMRTNVAHIFAIGDIVGQPMLAHKATHEGKVAAEVIAGHKSAFDARAIPSVAYTDPEIAWAGVTEEEAKAKGIAYEKGVFPWAASGRSLSLDRDEGVTKLIFDKTHGRIIGGAIVGPNAGDLIAEVVLAIEMGAEAEDIGLTIHPHPTLSETVAMAAEAVAGTLTDLYIPKKKK